ncbi:MAG: aldo/keto reductase [Pseudomonadales bacterium]|nr:aldo/keto reductase [Pseudomonadales bacterium]
MALAINTLGNSDVQVTELGFGGAPLGSRGSQVSDEQASQILEAAYDAGIRYFDTAPLYGHGLSERRLGGFLQTLPRDSFSLSSKVGRLLVPTGEGERHEQMGDEEPFSIRYDYSYDAARESLEATIERTGLDRIDVALCHDIDIWTHGDGQPEILKTARQGILPALSDLRSEGVIRTFGLGVNEWQICNEILDEFDVDCFLLAGRFTLLEQEPLDVFLPRCVEKNVSIIVGGPYNSGLLANAERRRATYDYKPVDDARWEKAQKIRAVCESHNIDMRAAALQYPLMHPAIESVIPGVWKMQELNDNIEMLATEIPQSLWSDLESEGLVRFDGIER